MTERIKERIRNQVMAVISGFIAAALCGLTKGEMIIAIGVSYISYEIHDFYNEYIRDKRK